MVAWTFSRSYACVMFSKAVSAFCLKHVNMFSVEISYSKNKKKDSLLHIANFNFKISGCDYKIFKMKQVRKMQDNCIFVQNAQKDVKVMT